MPDVITHGELLIDFVSTVSGVTLEHAPAFIKAPGGAPANVAVGLARLGVSSGFMGQVGDDPFGHFLTQTLRDNGVDVSHLRLSNRARTALAFVALRDGGERDFMFYHQPSADRLYRKEDVDADFIRSARVFHYGSISLIDDPARSATLRAIDIAQAAGLTLSYDPNLRLDLWPNSAAARAGIKQGWQPAHVVKVSEEELTFVAETDDPAKAACRLWTPNLRLLFVTQNKRGCRYVTTAFSGELPGFEVATVDTTGAGDGFVAGLLNGLLEHPGAFEDESALRAIGRYANAAGALTTTRPGAIPALPTAEQVAALLTQPEQWRG